MSKPTLLPQKVLAWYFRNIKYRKYKPHERKLLTTFEFGVRARIDLNTIIPVLMRLNILRVRALYDNDFDTVDTVDIQIGDTQSDYDTALKGLEELDQVLWRMVFLDFIKNHDDETCNRVWKVPLNELIALRNSIKNTSET